MEFLLPVVSRSDPRSASGGVSQTPAAAHSRKAAVGMGPAARTSQPCSAGVRGRAEGPHPHRVPARLRSGIESHRIHLGPRQAPQTSQRLPQGLRRVETWNPPRPPQHAPPPHPHPRLLETGFLVARLTLYYSGLSSTVTA